MNSELENRRCRVALALDALELTHEREGVAHELTGDFYLAALLAGCRLFFGIEISDTGELVRDAQNPRAFAAWRSH